MSKETEKAYQSLITKISDSGAKLKRCDYIDLVLELEAHVKSLLDCIRSEEDL